MIFSGLLSLLLGLTRVVEEEGEGLREDLLLASDVLVGSGEDGTFVPG